MFSPLGGSYSLYNTCLIDRNASQLAVVHGYEALNKAKRRRCAFQNQILRLIMPIPLPRLTTLCVARANNHYNTDLDTSIYFFLPPPLDVIFDVDIRSPMYFCKNLLLLSSLSCSSLTASIRLKISSSDFCKTFACLWLMVSDVSLDITADMFRIL